MAEPYGLRGLKLRLELDDAAIIRARPVALRRALRNLIDNAERYGGTAQTITLRTTALGDRWQIAVIDQGPGVPEAAIEQLKRPFVRLDEARSNPQGAGLGLAIVDRFAKAHDGRFDLANHPDGGLTAGGRCERFHLQVAKRRNDRRARGRTSEERNQ